MFKALLILLLATLALSEADDKDVIVLNKDNFDKIVNPAELILVEFYAPWCGHCKSLAPEYAKAATVLKSHDPPIPLAKVDATENAELAGRFSVNGYPTLFVFRNGKQSPYKGPRKADGIVTHMKKQVGPAAKPLETKEQANKFINSEDFTVVGFFAKESSQLKSSFLVISTKLREVYPFGKVTNPELFKEYGIPDDSLVIFRKSGEKTIYEGSSKTSEVEAWIDQNSLPLVGEFKESNAELYTRRNLPILRLFAGVDWKSNEKQTRYYANRLKTAAEEFRGKVLVAYAQKSAFEGVVNEFNIKDDEVSVILEDKGDKYRMESKFSGDAVLKFLRDFFAGTLRKYVRSERIPADNSGPVKTVVGLTFDEIVNNPEKDVLIEFYAPWCGHCKSLAPKYEELGQKLREVDSVVIAKLDATANDFDRSKYEVSGYPTLYFKPAKPDAKPIKYDGEREVTAMYNFIKQNAKKKFGKKK